MGNLIFITGGVRSGKSAFAEKLAKQYYLENNCCTLYYIAPGVAFDQEMKKRIIRHKLDRRQSGLNWTTIEIQHRLDFKVSEPQAVILWDCLTTWLNNVLFATEHLAHKLRMIEIEKSIDSLKKRLLHWQEEQCSVLLVSNEVLDEQISSLPEVNLYCSLLGRLHQWIVEQCDEAYEMDYSISKRRK
ncbi:bifunctional adenosylcobinamide kinase/adenosylcobinamide-phosphate guanylyltransferase [Lysinibacillus yapensis]|uniref:Adenosylcobinamide kinase n=1 Tax=Ureibacillus yapensis TaxID=2304605 RepID=A0A396SB44_9BACL|nr:bifunctional adenosylcobinamide kinase/adenosylcobinamide-phosphate guanylyltransferase [Lysinibacillus yapensis]RHW38544.1 bifunctional adenosylcobinamide kinase/adenosylcobinamide-phosphate guanylyltransferase [Lysinibacillus yapensis]